MKTDFDLTMIGGGVGGLVCSLGSVNLGARTALIEKNALGGDCLHYGCVPTKTLVRSAKVIQMIRRAKEFGVKKADLEFDFIDVMNHMRAIQAQIGKNDDPDLFRSRGIDVKIGTGQFVDPNTFQLNGDTIKSKKFVIATGTRPTAVPIPGLEETGYLTNETILKLETLPKTLVVLGGGPIGLELAHIFLRLGSKVIVIEKLGQILPREDKEVAQALEQILVKEGMEIYTCAEVKEIRKNEGKIIVKAQCQNARRKAEVEGETKPDAAGVWDIEGDQLLVAIGRRPNVEGLNLEAAGVQYERKGIKVDATMRTTAKNIWACGDVTGPFPFTHMAEYQAGIVVGNALFPFVNRKADYSAVPWVTYTDPELGRIGMTEEEAKEKHPDALVFRYELKDLDRAIIDGEAHGLIKIIVDRKKKKLLGAHVLAHGGGDLMQEYALALRNGIPITQISQTVHAYPTMAIVI
jgi:pyruvate/2-oxoglutarate dehydrogenase complex dihydrolipoamide dehydrogenase (E3) component